MVGTSSPGAGWTGLLWGQDQPHRPRLRPPPSFLGSACPLLDPQANAENKTKARFGLETETILITMVLGTLCSRRHSQNLPHITTAVRRFHGSPTPTDSSDGVRNPPSPVAQLLPPRPRTWGAHVNIKTSTRKRMLSEPVTSGNIVLSHINACPVGNPSTDSKMFTLPRRLVKWRPFLTAGEAEEF